MTYLQSNPQLELAFDYVANTNKNIFLTGKAGTGKTTFLHRIKNDMVKRAVVVAPTGVAAINAGGMTIHSFFQLPFGLHLPGNTRDPARQRKFAGEKIRLIQSLDLLIIDEISMVRADLLDAIDEVLRRYRDPYKPFGGVQLLLIGDLHQLPPIVKDDEWLLLREHYQTPYFFSSQALQKTGPVVVELKHIYRQSDDVFIDLLNKVRDNKMDADVLAALNSRFVADFRPGEEDAYITLSTHNATAHDINAQKLASIPQTAQVFRATIQGDFPTHAYPTDEVLELKIGAQVMFVKNDMAREKRYYNGKIGQITRINDGTIYVRCPNETHEISVAPVDWENVKYTLNEQTKEVGEQVLGTFAQYPLKLAWAITIHKSQGLTFERVILDAQAAFAHGQVYVALSRCKSFEGIVLRSKIAYSSVRTDSTVQHFSEAAEKNAPDEAHLEQSKAAFQQTLIFELFDFATLQRRFEQASRVLLEHENSLHPEAYRKLRALRDHAEEHLFELVAKFRPQLLWYFQQGGQPEQHAELQARIAKAGAWFAEKLGGTLLPEARSIQILTDNKSVRKSALEALANLQKEIFIKNACFAATQPTFSAHRYLRTKANADLDFSAAQNTLPAPPAGYSGTPQDTPNPELFARLVQWRADYAEANGLELPEVLLTKTLLEVAQRLPVITSDLRKVRGIGKIKSKQFGAEMLAIVRDYCIAQNLQTDALALPDPEAPKAPKPDSKVVTLDLYQSGKTIDEIAAERGFARTTIEGHLAYFVGLGELDIFDFMDIEDVAQIDRFFREHNTRLSAEAKAHFGDAYSYGQIKMVLEVMRLHEGEE
ncbi:MAG: AAA family ATPase [Lewinellaceae bacterium]|nr:AAA family ATPase [Lewinellaceae bacterium]